MAMMIYDHLTHTRRLFNSTQLNLLMTLFIDDFFVQWVRMHPEKIVQWVHRTQRMWT